MFNGISIHAAQFGEAWRNLLTALTSDGTQTSPRGIATREIIGASIHVDHGLCNVLVCPERNPSYRFMLAEFLWIISGRDDVQSICLFNKQISKFSDDGEKFDGAYGPVILRQLTYLIEKIEADRDTRQGVVSIWRPSPAPSKDIPCTLTYQALLRDDKMHGIVNMRSSDIWLGLPYDFYNFSMLTNLLAASFRVAVGSVTFNFGSSHLYEADATKAKFVLATDNVSTVSSPPLAIALPTGDDPVERATRLLKIFSDALKEGVTVKSGKDSPKRERPVMEAMIGRPLLRALLAGENKEALSVLSSFHR